jgi:hypothetical protein
LAATHQQKSSTNQADQFAKKLEDKLKTFGAGKSADFETKISGSLNELKTDLKELLSKGVKSQGSSGVVVGSGLTDADKYFLKELSNDTRDAIQDMRLEVLTASDKSKLNISFKMKNFCFKLIFFETFQVSQKQQLALRNRMKLSMKQPRNLKNLQTSLKFFTLILKRPLEI